MAISGACHCGDTEFELDDVPTGVTRCTCSICSKRGALWAYCGPAQFRLAQTPRRDVVYAWGRRIVKLHFCGVCGCTTYNESPTSRDGQPDFSAPLIAINARLLKGFDCAAVPMAVVDGENLW
jgi:hypothetical protein